MIQSLYVGNQFCLLLDLIEVDLIVGRVYQRVVILKSICRIRTLEILIFKFLPCLVCGFKFNSLHFRTRLDQIAYFLHLLLCGSLIKEYGDRNFLFHLMCNIIDICHHRIKNSYQEDAGCHGQDGCQ